jgi:hypothetical protein
MAFDHATYESGQCAICNLSFKGRNGLGRHIKWLHNLTLNEYFLMHGGENILCSCGRQSNWLFAKMQYSGYCSRKCAMTDIRSKCYDDLVYRDNISKAMQKVWSARPKSEQCILAKQQAANAKKKVIHSNDWILPPGSEESLSNFFNMHYGDSRTI